MTALIIKLEGICCVLLLKDFVDELISRELN